MKHRRTSATPYNCSCGIRGNLSRDVVLRFSNAQGQYEEVCAVHALHAAFRVRHCLASPHAKGKKLKRYAIQLLSNKAGMPDSDNVVLVPQLSSKTSSR